jgi:prevent-host-death family protein
MAMMLTIMAKLRRVNIGHFRQHAARYIREVEETARPLLITRRDVPVAELRPVSDIASLRGSVSVVAGVDLTQPVEEPGIWEANR